MNTIKAVELLSSSRISTHGRVLMIGGTNNSLKESIKYDFEDNKRFGIYGLNQNSELQWLGLPIISSESLAFYLLGIYLPAQRAVPLYAWIVSEKELEKIDYNISVLMASLSNYYESFALDLNTHIPKAIEAKVILFPKNMSVGIDIEQPHDFLKNNKTIRFDKEENTIDFIKRYLNSNKKLKNYCWSTAKFNFPSTMDGAKLHIASKNNNDRYIVNENVDMIKGSTHFPFSASKNSSHITPIILRKTKDSRNQFQHYVQVQHKTGVFKIISALFILVIAVFLLFSFFSGNTGNDTNFWTKNLGHSSFGINPIKKDVELILNAVKEMKTTSNKEESRTIKEFLPYKVDDISKSIADKIEANWLFIGDSSTIKFLKSLYEISAYDANIIDVNQYKEKILGQGNESLMKIISEIKEPSALNLRTLNDIKNISYAHDDLKASNKAAIEKYNWFSLLLKINNLKSEYSHKKTYNFYQQIEDVLYNAGIASTYQDKAKQIRIENMNEWKKHQSSIIKPIYNEMITGKIEFDLRKLLRELDEYDRIPNSIHSEIPVKIRSSLAELVDGKKIVIKINNIVFIKRFSYFSVLKNDTVLLESKYKTIDISKKKTVKIPVGFAFENNSNIELKVNGSGKGSHQFERNIIEIWIKNQKEIGKLDFGAVKAEYEVPTLKELGLEIWK